VICSECSPQLSAYLDDEMLPADRVALEAHLGTCADCSSQLAALRSVSQELRALPQIEVGADFRRRVLREIDGQRQELARPPAPRRVRPRWAWPTLGALGTLGAAAAAFLTLARGPTSSGDLASAADLAIAGQLELFQYYPSVQVVDAIDGAEDVAVVADLDQLSTGEGGR